MDYTQLQQAVLALGARNSRFCRLGQVDAILAEVPLPGGWTAMAFCWFQGHLHTWLGGVDGAEPWLCATASREEIWDVMLHSQSRAFVPILGD